MVLDDAFCQCYHVTGGINAPSEFIIVGEIIRHTFEAANGLECLARKCQRGAQSKAESTFQLSSRKDSGYEIAADPNGLQSCAECVSGDSTVQTRDHSHAAILELAHHLVEISATNRNVTIVDEHVWMPRQREHLDQVADFVIGAADLRAHHKPDVDFGKLFNKTAD